LSSATAANDANLMSKYKMGYAECVQECLRFMNNSSNNSMINSNVDPVTRQRLISNLMRQFQSINSTSSPSSNQLQQPSQSDQKPQSPLNNLICIF
jgi:hypothetical protein